MTDDIQLRYPIGKLKDQPMAVYTEYNEQARTAYINDIRFLPSLLEMEVENLDAEQLHTPYRPGGWTVQQVVHHVADSHMNAYMRFKLGLTEQNPAIKPYDQGAWAELSDTRNLPVNISLTLLHALHTRWCELLGNMAPSDWGRTVFHPEHQKSITLWSLLGTYSWHGKHHVAHIASLKQRMGW